MRVVEARVVGDDQAFECPELLAQHEARFGELAAGLLEREQRVAPPTSASQLEGQQPPAAFVERQRLGCLVEPGEGIVGVAADGLLERRVGFRVDLGQGPIARERDLGRVGQVGERLALPDGWTFTVRTLDRDLDLLSTDGVATIVQDELQNTYQRVDRVTIDAMAGAAS